MSELLFQENCKVATFKAPESDNYRQVVLDHMMEMANFEWTPKETFNIKLRTERTDMGLNLTYEKGKKYHGVTYCFTKASLDEFLQLFEDGEFVADYDNVQIVPCSISSVSERNNYQPKPLIGSEYERLRGKIIEISSGFFGIEDVQIMENALY